MVENEEAFEDDTKIVIKALSDELATLAETFVAAQEPPVCLVQNIHKRLFELDIASEKRLLLFMHFSSIWSPVLKGIDDRAHLPHCHVFNIPNVVGAQMQKQDAVKKFLTKSQKAGL